MYDSENWIREEHYIKRLRVCLKAVLAKISPG